MTQFLPPNLLALFAARDPIPYLPPADKLPHEKKTRGYAGVGAFLGSFEVSLVLLRYPSGCSDYFRFRILKIPRRQRELRLKKNGLRDVIEKKLNKSHID